MGIFNTTLASSVEEGGVKDVDALIGSYIIDEVSMLPEAKIQEFINSEECKALQERGTLKKKTIVRLSKKDDLTRRKKMAAFQIAKENHWKEWDLLVKNRIKEKQLIEKIVHKAGLKADKAAKLGQKEYLSTKMPLAFMRK